MSFVKAIINKWDPIDLLSFAPEDEYQIEIEQVELLLCVTEDVSVLSEGIFEIFTYYFGNTFQRSREECMEVAKLLISEKAIG
jgi:hypothetical protein